MSNLDNPTAKTFSPENSDSNGTKAPTAATKETLRAVKSLQEEAHQARVDQKSDLRSAAPEAAPEQTGDFKHHLVEGGSSMLAGIGGGAFFALSRLPVRFWFLRLPLSAAAGGFSKLASKSTAESLFFAPCDRTASFSDLGWGMVDGLAGVFGATAESLAARTLSRSMGSSLLGRPVSWEMAELAGRRFAEDTVRGKIMESIVRGSAGGLAGTFAYTIPHSTIENRELLFSSRWHNGLSIVARDAALNCSLGSVAGGIFGAGISACFNSKAIAGHLSAALKGDRGVSRLTILHTNDMHSNLLGDCNIARLATKADLLKARAQSRGHSVELVDTGDEYSGNVIAGFTKNGEIENAAMSRMGYSLRVFGNHAKDGVENFGEYVKIIDKFGREKVVAANVSVDEALGLGKKPFQGYRIKEMHGPQGTERIGYIGLVTHELEGKGAGISSAIDEARALVCELQKQGVNKIVVLSHLGLEADRQLAMAVKEISAIVGGHSHDALTQPVWVSTAEKGQASASDRQIPIVQAGSNGKWLGEFELAFKADGSVDRFRTKGRLHPISSDIAEHEGVLSVLNERNVPQVDVAKALNIDESTLRDQIAEMTGRRPPPDRKLTLKEVERIFASQKGYGNFRATADYSVDGIRERETALGNLISDALFAGINRKLTTRAAEQDTQPVLLNAFLKHSGDIRNGISKDSRLTLYDYANMFCNGQNHIELTTARVTGKQLKQILEFSMEDIGPANNIQRDPAVKYAFEHRTSMDHAPGAPAARRLPVPPPGNISLKARIERALAKAKSKAWDPVFSDSRLAKPDHSGNFLQVSGIKADYDLNNPGGARVSNMRIFHPESECYVSIQDEEVYLIGTLKHPVEKWGKNGVFFDDQNFWQRYDAILAAKGQPGASTYDKQALELAAKRLLDIDDGLNLSQPDETADFFAGATQVPPRLLPNAPARTKDGALILHPSRNGRIEPRLRDITEAPRRAGPYAILADAILSFLHEEK